MINQGRKTLLRLGVIVIYNQNTRPLVGSKAFLGATVMPIAGGGYRRGYGLRPARRRAAKAQAVRGRHGSREDGIKCGAGAGSGGGAGGGSRW